MTCALILAAGDGKRMKAPYPKVLCKVAEKPMIRWVVDAVKAAGIGNICLVLGDGGEQVEVVCPDAKYVYQHERLGTGHAVGQAGDYLKDFDDVLVLCGDAPFVSQDVIADSLNQHKDKKNQVTVIGANLADPTGYGRLLINDGKLYGNIEQKDADEEQQKITLVNSGAYWFETKALLKALAGLKNDNAQGEYYLPDTIALILENGGRAGVFETEDDSVVLGANDRKGLLTLCEIAKDRITAHHMDEGVEFVGIDGVVISPDVIIGAGTTIYPGTILKGKTVIGRNCVIGPNTLIEDSEVEDGVALQMSVIEQSKVLRESKIGPWVHFRPDSVAGPKAKIGNFVELKNTYLGEGTSVAHLTYLGDSKVGKFVNFGCGAVTANYDGELKHVTVIKDHAFIGCNTNLIAPVTVGEGAYTAAGSTITEDIPDAALAIERGQQKNLLDYGKRKQAKRIEKNEK